VRVGRDSRPCPASRRERAGAACGGQTLTGAAGADPVSAPRGRRDTRVDETRTAGGNERRRASATPEVAVDTRAQWRARLTANHATASVIFGWCPGTRTRDDRTCRASRSPKRHGGSDGSTAGRAASTTTGPRSSSTPGAPQRRPRCRPQQFGGGYRPSRSRGASVDRVLHRRARCRLRRGVPRRLLDAGQPPPPSHTARTARPPGARGGPVATRRGRTHPDRREPSGPCRPESPAVGRAGPQTTTEATLPARLRSGG